MKPFLTRRFSNSPWNHCVWGWSDQGEAKGRIDPLSPIGAWATLYFLIEKAWVPGGSWDVCASARAVRVRDEGTDHGQNQGVAMLYSGRSSQWGPGRDGGYRDGWGKQVTESSRGRSSKLVVHTNLGCLVQTLDDTNWGDLGIILGETFS